jgi:hypothetical protein
VAIFGIFSCTRVESGRAYLDADVNIQCFVGKHPGYVGAGIIWIVVVTLGVPAFFIALLRHFKVPQMAAVMTDNCWLREAVKLAWQERVPQPDVDIRRLTIDSISDAHLKSLAAFFLHGASSDEAAEILAGTAPPMDLRDEGKEGDDQRSPRARRSGGGGSPPASPLARLMQRVQTRVFSAAGCLQRTASGGSSVFGRASGGAAADPALELRRKVMAELLAWCKTSSDLSIPVLRWEDEDDDSVSDSDSDSGAGAGAGDSAGAEAGEKMAAASVDAAAAAVAAAADEAARAMGPVPCSQLVTLQRRAMLEVGFLFAAYRADCWRVARAAAARRRSAHPPRSRRCAPRPRARALGLAGSGRWWSCCVSWRSPPSWRSSRRAAAARLWWASRSPRSRSS